MSELRKQKIIGKAEGSESQAWQKLQVKGDGNCFYRCLSKHIYGSEDKHKDIRQKVTDHIEQNMSKFRWYIDGPV